jgi:HlyD family secretion protein
VLLVPNAALRFKPAIAGKQKPADNHPAAASGGAAKPGQDAFSARVYVLEQGELAPLSVSLGITDNRNTEITGGDLKAGDQIIVGEAQAADKSKSSGSRPPMRMF